MQLILIELNELNFEYAKRYFESLKIDTIRKISKNLINTESEDSQELLESLTQAIVKNPHHYYRLINHEKFLKKLGISFLKVEPRMSRDFLIHFSNINDRDKAFEKLKKIKIKNEIFFGVLELKDNSIFATLTYNKEILKNDSIIIENRQFKIIDQIVFVALKNGYHEGRGFLFAKGEIEKNFNNLQNIKIFEIKNKIKDFFQK